MRNVGNGLDSFGTIQQTTEGGYIVAGSTHSSTLGAGGFDFWVFKLDSTGNITWQKTYGEEDQDFAWSIMQTSDGGYVVTGGNWVLKLDANGSVAWQKTFVGAGYNEAYSIQQTSDNGYIITGTTSSFGAGGEDVYLIKLCSEGTSSGDLNCDGTVDYEDVDILVSQWLQPQSILKQHADIYGFGDGIVNFLDYAVQAEDFDKSSLPH